MISLSKIGSDGRDGTARYYTNIDYEYKVGEFVKSILDERTDEWGEITIKPNEGKKEWQDIVFSKNGTGTYSCEYAYGKLKSRFEKDILEKNIVSICAYGGYSLMDYVIIVDK